MMPDRSDLSAIAALLREVAGSIVMPRFGHIGPADLRTKSGPLDPVTVADEAAERALTEGLRALFPDVAVIGEESVAADPALLGAVAGPAPVFVIDPIDGTQNYAAGLPLFGLMIALVEGNQTIAGLIHDPLRDDTMLATRGAGAFLLRGAAERAEFLPLRVAAPAPLAQMIASVSWQYMAADEKSRVLARLDAIGQTPNLRCAAATYRAMASGHMHATVSRRTLPWDHAAGTLIVEEAGGHVRRPDGEAWRPADIDGGLIAAADRDTWHRLRDALYG
ncbi:inositol monophosphatase family protein [Acidiphilium sp. C61]|jgi:fructose-1,6-bisphosphatase/inositol monophosphatase family enzyme|uniref:inositol monophosphatase family protein n=1 Tax=Acidiphilium sp. C61 TaxID=1671485 RepID=UPI00157A38B9|nr:inositol monophosphatase family protein [Acidiphilium sp. C61]